MSRLALFGVLAVTLSTTALAADLPVYKRPLDLPVFKGPPVPPPAPQGPYIGVFGGYSWGPTDVLSGKTVSCVADFADCSGELAYLGAANSRSGNKGAPIVGGQFGYDFQVASALRVGAVVDATALNRSGGSSVTAVFPNLEPGDTALTSNISSHWSTKWLSTTRLKIGPTFGPVYLYATGGLAIGGVSSNASTFSFQQAGIGGNYLELAGNGGKSDTRFGYAVGAGLSYSFLRNFSLSVEYLHYALAARSYTVYPVSLGNEPVNTLPFTVNSRASGNLVRVGLNYRLW